jgi:hypothetical protein
MDETSGTSAIDASGYQNHGVYNFAPSTNIMPLVFGGVYATKFIPSNTLSFSNLKNYNGIYKQGCIADKYSSDAAFSLEVWANFYNTSSANIFSDLSNSIGLTWENNGITFSIGTNKIYYLPENKNESMHIVGVYSQNLMQLYVNGYFVGSSDITGFLFTNSSFSPAIGSVVTSQSDGYMLIDAPAIYRYKLSKDQIEKHYNGSNGMSPIQISDPEDGKIFSSTSTSILNQLNYFYPQNKDIQSLQGLELKYEPTDKFLYMEKTSTSESKTVIVKQILDIPMLREFVNSKIEWSGNNGIEVYTNDVDDDATYVLCQNGFPIPQYSTTSFSDTKLIYIKIVFTSSDISKYIPKLNYLNITFYENTDLYAYNYGFYISSSGNLNVGSIKAHPILRKTSSGVQTGQNNRLSINFNEPIKSIESVVTMYSKSANLFINSSNSNLSWTTAGVLSKTNIASFYINGQLIPDGSNIWNYIILGQPYHLAVNLTSSTNDLVYINSQTGPNTRHEDLSIYPNLINALEHYNMYIDKTTSIVSDQSMIMTEKGFTAYNYDFKIVKTV